MFSNVVEDIRVYAAEHGRMSLLPRVAYLLFRYELWAVLIYRFGRWAHYNFKFPFLSFVFRVVYFFLRKFSEIILDIGIWPESEIGAGFNIHNSGIYIKARIGKNCVISTGIKKHLPNFIQPYTNSLAQQVILVLMKSAT